MRPLDHVGPRLEAMPRLRELGAVRLGTASTLKSRSTMSSPIRCSTSRFTHGREPSRTVSSCGWYCVAPGVRELRRQAEARGLALMLVRQSTQVPKTSKISARIASAY